MNSFIDELRDAGHEVLVTTTGEETMRFLRTGEHQVDLVILDIMLPRGQRSKDGTTYIGWDVKAGEMGVDVLRQLREEIHVDVPVIVVTAVIDDDLRIRAQEYGVTRYFVKPISLSTFMDEVEEALNAAISPSRR